MWKSCRFPHPRVDNLWNSTSHQPWNDRYATRITWPEPARLAQHPPRPFETDFLRQRRRAGLRTRDEVERGADAEQSGSVELIKTARRKQFLTRSAERAEEELRPGGAEPLPQGRHKPDNGKTVGCNKTGPTIGRAKIRPLLQLHNMIEIERADAE